MSKLDIIIYILLFVSLISIANYVITEVIAEHSKKPLYDQAIETKLNEFLKLCGNNLDDPNCDLSMELIDLFCQVYYYPSCFDFTLWDKYFKSDDPKYKTWENKKRQ